MTSAIEELSDREIADLVQARIMDGQWSDCTNSLSASKRVLDKLPGRYISMDYFAKAREWQVVIMQDDCVPVDWFIMREGDVHARHERLERAICVAALKAVGGSQS